MADLLPQFIIMKRTNYDTSACAHYSTKPASKYVYANGGDVFDPYARIEVETANFNTNYVHLRFYHSNRYWAKSEDDKGMVAVSKQPEEDIHKKTCTLFEPSVKGVFIRFTHVHSQKRVRTDDHTSLVYVDDRDDSEDGFYDFTFMDWETLVKCPQRVAFKGDNGKYLQAYTYQGNPYLRFSSSDANEESAAFEVMLHPDGHFRIKSVYFNKFWIDSYGGWIWADSTGEFGKNNSYLFWPYKIDDKTVALKNASMFNICTRLTDDERVDCLNASAHSITKEAHLVVEELVDKRSIYHVDYRMEDARVYDEQPFLAGTGDAVNESDEDSFMAITVTYQHTHSTSFNYTMSFTFGGKASGEIGIPFVEEGKVEISASTTHNFDWGNTNTEQISAQATYTAKVPPKSRVVVNYVATQGTCSVPFSYTNHDTSSSDGQTVSTRHIDGVFVGTNYYSFHFHQPKFQLLSTSS